ncbi:DUF3263 domain-containing protein [Micromonospora sp. NBC_01655]|uniref:DUF3263 domain-containing protein n=1 Tax=Micromonospora sp. NBC_01655 TaxID=2975983 RepID=UPI002253E78A|nr:DUF3263 domain-containing protein [Micromonospora sp. NBC_01655]MCX4469732.1 DUF3263 domain-containing protein [Micromonospora sp. NBC_01655]
MPPADASPAATDRPEPARPGDGDRAAPGAAAPGAAAPEGAGGREQVVPLPRSAPESVVPESVVPESVAPASAPPAPTPGAAGLTERERHILAFEQQWWRHAGAKEQAIRDGFGLSATRYYQLLNALLDNPAALAAEPVLIGRLRRLRSSRARNRRR